MSQIYQNPALQPGADGFTSDRYEGVKGNISIRETAGVSGQFVFNGPDGQVTIPVGAYGAALRFGTRFDNFQASGNGASFAVDISGPDPGEYTDPRVVQNVQNEVLSASGTTALGAVTGTFSSTGAYSVALATAAAPGTVPAAPNGQIVRTDAFVIAVKLNSVSAKEGDTWAFSGPNLYYIVGPPPDSTLTFAIDLMEGSGYSGSIGSNINYLCPFAASISAMSSGDVNINTPGSSDYEIPSDFTPSLLLLPAPIYLYPGQSLTVYIDITTLPSDSTITVDFDPIGEVFPA